MERNTINTLAVKFWATIETPPLNNREHFRQGVIDTILKVLKMRSVTIEYIGYKPAKKGVHNLNSIHTVYEDCVFVSLSMSSGSLHPPDENLADVLISDFINVFESKTHRHLEVDSENINRAKKQRVIEMTSDWKYYLKHA